MKKIIFTIGIAVVTAANVFAGGGKELLVDTEWLDDNLDKKSVLVVETGRKLDDYTQGHVPGAVFIDRAEYYDEVNGIPGMFSGIDRVVESLENAGISNRTHVVIYDKNRALWSTRLFWTLEYLGHKRVSVLDGGLAKWEAEERPLDSGNQSVVRGKFTPKLREGLNVTGDWVVENYADEDVQILDARSSDEYVGTDIRSERGGHIPEAVNVDWVLALTDEEPNVFLPKDELIELYQANEIDSGNRIVTLCQTGVRGAHTYFVLRLLGYKDVALYDGSWAEWGNDQRFPVSIGG